MAVITSPQQRTAHSSLTPFSVDERRGLAFARKAAAASAVLLLLWLCLRDWLTSSVAQYPYAVSLIDTIAILIGALAAGSKLSASRLWDLLTVAGAVICVLAYLPMPSAYTLALYHASPMVPVFTLALALPRTMMRAGWPSRINLVSIGRSVRRALTEPVDRRTLVVSVRSGASAPISPQVRWAIAVSASLAACAALIFDARTQSAAQQPSILLFSLAILACLRLIRWISLRQKIALIPASFVAMIFCALYIASPFASRLATLVFGDSQNGSPPSGALILNWILACVAPFFVIGVLELLWPSNKASADRLHVNESETGANVAAEKRPSIKLRGTILRPIGFVVLLLICLGLEVVWSGARSAYLGQGLWCVSALVCAVTLPDLIAYARRLRDEPGNQKLDRFSERLNKKVDFRGIAKAIAKSIRSFLTWKIDLAAIIEKRHARSTKRRYGFSAGNSLASPSVSRRLSDHVGIGQEFSPLSIAMLQALALMAGIMGLLLAPNGDAHAPSIFSGLWLLPAVILIRKVGSTSRVRQWGQFCVLGAICLFPIVSMLRTEINPPVSQPNDFRILMLGSGMERFPSESGLEFIGEQGLITWLLIGAALIWGVRRAAGVLGKQASVSSQESTYDGPVMETHGRENGEAKMDLFCAASVAMIGTLYWGLSFSNPGVLLTTAISIGALFGISRTSQTPRRAASPWRWRVIALAACVVFAIGAGVRMYSRALAGGSSPGASVAWKDLPPSAAKVLSANVPFAMTWPEGHALIRRCFGAQLNTPLSAPAYIAARITGSDYSRNPLRSAAATLLGMQLSSDASMPRIYELYVNLQDYGYIGGGTDRRTSGIAQASREAFGVMPAGLNEAQMEFLLGSPIRVDNLSLIEAAAPIRFAESPANYKYTPYSAAGLPAVGGWEMHNGVLNNQGAYASYMVASGMFPYVSSLKGATPISAYNTSTQAWSLNNSGQIAGSSSNWAARWDRRGDIQNLGVLPGFTNCAARAINDRGDVAGYAWNNNAPEGETEFRVVSHAFLWSHGRMRDLGVPHGYVSSRAYAINNRGQVAGWLLTKSGQTHAMLWQDGVMHDLGTFPGGQTSVVNAINDAGQVVGSSQHQGGAVTACLWQNGRILDLGRLPGDVYSRALGINDLGQIVGESRLDTNVNYAGGVGFIWDAKHGMRNLWTISTGDKTPRTKTAHCTAAVSINDQSEILGYGFYEVIGEPRRHFLLRPLNH
ncbi:MAG: hypothetical protein ABIY70_19985 [Capsulimonas sp.]|uniref:hypothetical protein n=1 Tax=Capsulimonas sp. TaxID=2494211 RepID=UPI00326569C3